MSLKEAWLSGWDAISKHVGRSVRTAKRYHYLYHMPVRKLPGSVHALPYELDLWLIEFDKLRRGHKRK